MAGTAHREIVLLRNEIEDMLGQGLSIRVIYDQLYEQGKLSVSRRQFSDKVSQLINPDKPDKPAPPPKAQTQNTLNTMADNADDMKQRLEAFMQEIDEMNKHYASSLQNGVEDAFASVTGQVRTFEHNFEEFTAKLKALSEKYGNDLYDKTHSIIKQYQEQMDETHKQALNALMEQWESINKDTRVNHRITQETMQALGDIRDKLERYETQQAANIRKHKVIMFINLASILLFSAAIVAFFIMVK